MSLLPIFLKLAVRRCLLVGAGNVALEKIGSLLRTGLDLRVIAPTALPEVRALASEGKLEWVQRPFEISDLDGNFMVIAATDVPAVNALVYKGSVERNIPCNSVDDIPNCDFFFGSVVRRGSLQIAISTAGESPAVAQRLRREIDQQLPEDLGTWLEDLGSLRREVLEAHPRTEARKLLLHQLAQRPVCDSETCPSRLIALAPLEADEVEEPEELEWESAEESFGVSDEDSYTVEASAQRFDQTGAAETVFLVGAGPGDPDLLTVKALRLIQTTDVLLHDDLVLPAILDFASPSAEIVNVGKRCGTKTITQNEINNLMIDHARAGRTVVRLKGGDPMLFGRAAEEIGALSEAGVPFEIVPGITAAFAAAAALGCSLTDRGSASSVVFSTGHRAHPDRPQTTPNSQLQKEDATRVVYMPGRDLEQLAQEWMAQGLPPELPCALVSRAAQPDQEICSTTLGKLGQAKAAAAPSLLIAGWAVAARGYRHS